MTRRFRYGLTSMDMQPAIAVSRAPSFKDVGFLVAGPSETTVEAQPAGVRSYKVVPRVQFQYSDPPELLGVSLWRRQPVIPFSPVQYGTDAFALGHYVPFRMPRPVGGGPGDQPVLAEMHNSAYQPISRGGHLLISLTEVMGRGPSATWRSFGNTMLGLWQKAWVIGGANVRPLGSQQTPSPQFRGVLPTYGYMTIPSIIGR